jgi:DNA-binding response OmpR family regulator
LANIRILLTDNDPDFLSTCAEYLEGVGYQVYKAVSPAEARRVFEVTRIHLIILDLRLMNDEDQKDRSGLALAKELAWWVPKLILTRFPTYQDVREALKLDIQPLPPVVDFVDKRDGLESLREAIEQALTKYVPVNWNLPIQWGANLSLLHLASLIEPDMDIPDRTDELEELFRRLFFQNSQITISHILTAQKHRLVLAVFAFSETGEESQFIITCGLHGRIKAEEENYYKYSLSNLVEGGLSQARSAETLHFAGISYAFTGGNLEELTNLSEFYRSNPAEPVIAALNHVFNVCLIPRYERGRVRREDKSLTDFYTEWLGLDDEVLTQSELGHRLEAMCRATLAAGLDEITYSPTRLTFQLANDLAIAYPNPVITLIDRRLGASKSVLCGFQYGQLDSDGIAVDRQGRSWLIDFSRVGQGPLLGDFIALEMSLKFDWLAPVNLGVRHKLETRLLAMASLGDEIDGTGLAPEFGKALQAIGHVRRLAASVVSPDPEAYLVGLVFYTVRRLARYNPTMRHPRPQLMPYLHCLLSAAMICEKLTPPPRQDLPVTALENLWINEANEEVWVEGRLVRLTPGEFKLLLYLYQHQEHLCTFAEIMENVFEAKYEPNMSEHERKRLEEPRLNSAISRLRNKIEPNPSHPKYIVTVRSKGYKLAINYAPASQ